MSIPALLIATVVGTLMSMVWHSPRFFGKGLKNKHTRVYFLVFLNTLLLSVVLGQFIRAFNTEANLILGMLLGGLVGLGFITPAIATNYLLESKKISELIPTVLHHVVVTTLAGGVIALLS